MISKKNNQSRFAITFFIFQFLLLISLQNIVSGQSIIGKWNLESGTYNGSPINNLTGYFNINDGENYAANFNDGTNKGSVSAKYTMSGNTFKTNISGTQLVLNGMSSSYTIKDGKIVYLWTASMSCSQTVFNQWGASAIGYNSPVVTANGNTLTIKSANGKAVLTYKKDGSSLSADFSAEPTSGQAPLSVQFQNKSTGDITGYLWDFGDGTTSTSQNPSHTYQNIGSYTVKLTVTGSGGTNTKIKTNYITVLDLTNANYTFYVSIENFSLSQSDKVGIRGSVPPLSWGSSVIMSYTGENQIYKVIVDFKKENLNQELEFKFVIEQTGGNVTWEEIVGPAGPYGNRNLLLIPGIHNLPVLTFNKKATLITYFVDMTSVSLNSNEKVGLRGSQAPLSWENSLEMSKLDKSNIFYITTAFGDELIHSNLEYKFVIDRQGGEITWEGKVGPGGDYGNRAISIPAGYMVLPTVSFNENYTDINSINIPSIAEYRLEQNYPNPFNPKTKISYSLNKDSFVKVQIFNLKGELIQELYNGFKPAGHYILEWDASDAASGTYLIKMESEGQVNIRKCLLLK